MIEKWVKNFSVEEKYISLYDAEYHIELCTGDYEDDENEDDNNTNFIITVYNIADDIKLNMKQLFTLYDMIAEMKKEIEDED